MNAQELIATARALVAGDKGLLAMDEDNPTCSLILRREEFPRLKKPGALTGSSTAPRTAHSVKA